MMSSEQWQNLLPNFPNPNALLPKELTIKDIATLFAAIAAPEILESFEPTNPQSDERTIPGVGTLRILGSGEEKHGYLLTTEAGKKLVILLQRAFNLPLEIPQDPCIYNRWGYEGKPTNSAYSDFRTYLSAPVTFKGHEFGIHLQEAGGRSLGDAGDDVPQSLEKEKIRQVYNQASKYGFNITEWSELRRADHYLKTDDSNGTYGIIDIPLSNRYQNNMAYYAETAKRNDPPGMGRLLEIAAAPAALVPLLPLPRSHTKAELLKQ